MTDPCLARRVRPRSIGKGTKTPGSPKPGPMPRRSLDDVVPIAIGPELRWISNSTQSMCFSPTLQRIARLHLSSSASAVRRCLSHSTPRSHTLFAKAWKTGLALLRLKVTQTIAVDEKYQDFFQHLQDKQGAKQWGLNLEDRREAAFTNLLISDTQRCNDRAQNLVELLADALTWRRDATQCKLFRLWDNSFTSIDSEVEVRLPFGGTPNPRHQPREWFSRGIDSVLNEYHPGPELSKIELEESVALFQKGVSRGTFLFLQSKDLLGRSELAALTMMVVAVETATKEAIVAKQPSTKWLWENVPSPPLHKLVKNFLAEIEVLPSEVAARFHKGIQRAVELRNKVVHGAAEIDGISLEEAVGEEFQSITTNISNYLYALDYHFRGFDWARVLSEKPTPLPRSKSNKQVRDWCIANIAAHTSFFQTASPQDGEEPEGQDPPLN